MSRRLWTAALAAVAAFQLGLVLWQRAATVDPSDYCREDSDYDADRGEALLHGAPVLNVTRSMPGYSVSHALLCRHLPPAAAAAVRAGSVVGAAVLVFAAASSIHSPLAGAAASLIYAATLGPGPFDDRWLYSLSTALVGYACAGSALWLGLATAASLLVLSPLFFFPLIEGSAVVLAASFIPLLPWAALNWRLLGRFTPFEAGRAEANIIAGALGHVATPGAGDPRALAGLSASDSVLLWAAGEVGRHPVRYAWAFLRRAAFAFSLHPGLAAAALASIWFLGNRRLSVLAGGLAAALCMMPVEARYFTPLWPLLAVLAGVLAASWAPKAPMRFSPALAALAAAPLLVFDLWGLGAAAAYPFRLREASPAADSRDAWLWSQRGKARLRSRDAEGAARDLARALALAPSRDYETDYAWALLIRGGRASALCEAARPPSEGYTGAELRAHLLRGLSSARGGRMLAAREAFQRARDYPLREQARLLAEILSCLPPKARASFVAGIGRAAPELLAPLAADWLDYAAARKDPAELDFARSLPLSSQDALRAGRLYLELGDYRGALALFRGAPVPALLMETAYAARDAGKRRDALAAVALAARSGLDARQRRDAVLLLRELGEPGLELAALRCASRGDPELAGRLLDLAEGAQRRGLRGLALEALSAARGLRLSEDSVWRAAQVYGRLGAYDKELSLLKGSGAAARLAELASVAGKAGRRDVSLEALKAAEKPGISASDAARLADVYFQIGEPRRALALYRRLAPGDAELELDTAEAAAAAGEKDAAYESLRSAGKGRPGPDALFRMAMVYQSLGAYAPALKILDRLVRLEPAKARRLADRGVLEALMGRREQAARDLREALRLDPGQSSAARSLASLRAAP